MSWFFLSIIALFSLSIMSLLITMLTRQGFPVPFVLLGIGVIFVIAYSLQTFVFSSPTFTITPGTIGLLLLIGLLSVIGNFALFQAANDAPNAGLALIIGSGLMGVVVSILAVFFLKDKLTFLQIFGIFLAIFAIILINIGSSQSQEQKTSNNKTVKTRSIK